LEGSLRDRLAALSRRELAVLLTLTLIVVGGAGLWYLRSLPGPVEVRAVTRATASAVPTQSPAILVVHVAGQVRRPGVYEFEEGDRVVDAIQAAHGPRKHADLDALNLAAPLTDGQQVLVPSKAPGSGPGGPTGAVGTSPGLVNVNTASADELETLSGIGPVLAQSIVDYRTENGPFPTVDALLDVSGIGPATLDEIRDHVTV
jgi:competence protein ComEA